MHKPYPVPHASQITTLGTIFTEIYFGVSKEGVRSWKHVFLVTKLKTLPKKLLAVRPEKVTRRKKRKKIEWQLQSFFALNANAKNHLEVSSKN